MNTSTALRTGVKGVNTAQKDSHPFCTACHKHKVKNKIGDPPWQQLWGCQIQHPSRKEPKKEPKIMMLRKLKMCLANYKMRIECPNDLLTLADGPLRLNPLNPSKKNDFTPGACQRHTVAPLHKNSSPPLIQTLLSPYFSSDASVVSGNSLQKIEKWWPAAQGEPWDSAVFEMQRKEPLSPVWFITADDNRQVLRRNTPTECTKGRQIMRAGGG